MNARGKFVGNELKYIAEYLDSENGKNKTEPWVGRFEEAFAKRLERKYAIAHNSGTSTLHSCLVAAGVGEGDEVIVPAQTVAMLVFATLMQRAIPVFADIETDTLNICPDDVARKITDRTKAIMPVHMHGLPASMDPIMELARKHDIPVIEDSAQCLLGEYQGRQAGSIGHMASFSFESKKHISVGEGGMVVTDSEEYGERIRKFGGLGYKTLRAGAGMRQVLPSEFQEPHFKRHDTLGLNYRMPDICGALGLAQLERVDALVGRRQRVARYFLDALDGCAWIRPQRVHEGIVHSYWTFTVTYDGEDAYGVPWRAFYDMYKKNGGDGFYGGLSVTYQEPFMRVLSGFTSHLSERYPIRDNAFHFEEGLCPVAEAVQPKMMQFKTNYRDMGVAEQRAEALAKTIRAIE